MRKALRKSHVSAYPQTYPQSRFYPTSADAKSRATIVDMKKRFAYIVAALITGVNLNAGAQVYRCKTATGGTEYSQVPCGKDAQLLQSQRDSIDTTNPPADPFGVQRERERLQLETDYYRKKSSGGMTGKSVGASSTSRAARQVDSVACERADREALIEARHARKDATAIRRTQKTADWECGRGIADEDTPVARKPTVLSAPPTPPPNLASCDASGCWDTSAGRYNRSGSSDTYFSPSGKACTKVGTQIMCP